MPSLVNVNLESVLFLAASSRRRLLVFSLQLQQKEENEPKRISRTRNGLEL